MIDISSAKVDRIIVHKVGNKIREESFNLSSDLSQSNPDLQDLFLKNYLHPLSIQKDIYNFFHESDITLNAAFKFITQIFNDNSVFVEQTHNLAKHLYSVSTHPNISSGELIIFLISDIRIDGQAKQGLAILKIENREEYLDVIENGNKLELTEKSGISLTKIQKGALIINDSFQVSVIDNLSQKTKYWLDNFLKVIPKSTPESYAKLGSNLLKKISNKIEDTKDVLALKNTLNKKIKEDDEITLNEIREISSEYILKNDVDKIFEQTYEKANIVVDNNTPFNTDSLSKYIKKIVKQTKISDGLELLVSDPNYLINSVDIKKNENGFQAIINIDCKE
ncbi:nucleoid-associated protein [Acinetobacter pittii]|uniref:hypothetical protein n=1 Tax=Acinetobacter pittii TaxID=48296 RepID=UPI00355C361A